MADLELGDFQEIAKAVEPEVLPPTKSGVTPPQLVPFKPGTTLNPGGRPKKTLLDNCLTKALEVFHEGTGKTKAQVLAETMVDKAIQTMNVSLIKMIAERTQGLPTQKVEAEVGLHVTVERIG